MLDFGRRTKVDIFVRKPLEIALEVMKRNDVIFTMDFHLERGRNFSVFSILVIFWVQVGHFP